jgi:hypothetical protein
MHTAGTELADLRISHCPSQTAAGVPEYRRQATPPGTKMLLSEIPYRHWVS